MPFVNAATGRLRVTLDKSRVAAIFATAGSGLFAADSSQALSFNRDIRSRPDHNLRARIALDDIAVGRARLGLGVWGDNLTDQRNIDFGIDFGSLGYASASFKKPRSFGFDARITY